MKRVVIAAVLAVALPLLIACGGPPTVLNTTTSSTTPPVSISISPLATTMNQSASLQFTATVTGSSNSAVTWSITEGSTGGEINSQGTYTAPDKAGVFHVVASSAADPTKQASATINVNAIALNVSPVSTALEPGSTLQFTAVVTGTLHSDINWSVQEGAAGGTITAGGMYTAPDTPGSFHVVATSASDKSAANIVTVTVNSLAVVIRPGAMKLLPGSARTFSATVLGCLDDRVTWAVQETGAGSITSEGTYTAPNTLGEFHVIATSIAHPDITAIAPVVVDDVGFVYAGEMTTARFGHTATLLPNGDVLITGGTYSQPDVVAAELFDHVSGTFRKIGDMTEPRSFHTATYLPSTGKVLIVGGTIDGGFGDISLASAELYDPATGQFSATGKMSTRHGSHTATLLSDGRVLIAGGFWSDDWTATAEIYDPSTGLFTQTGSMSNARAEHTATRLADGRVLIVGGTTWLGNAPDEIYDPATGAFTASAITIRRGSHTATWLEDGRILLTGGRWIDYGPWITTVYDDAQFYDPASGLLTSAGKMNEFRWAHTATRLLNGSILIAGGYGKEQTVSTSERFDPAVSTFVTDATMNAPRAYHAATMLLDGRVLITGGSGDQSAELYLPKP